DREMGYLFDALGLDVHDKPGEDPNCDAVVASNGGMAHVYLQNRQGRWMDAAGYQEDVLPVARAFWDANMTGKYAGDLQNSLAAVLVRNVEQDGWGSVYKVFLPDGLLHFEEYLFAHPELETIDAVSRLEHLAEPFSGDLILLANYREGYYFGSPMRGTHGGLHPHDSLAVLTIAWVGASEKQVLCLRSVAQDVVTERCRSEWRELSSLTDLLPILRIMFQWAKAAE
ncbi:MAG: hypothetical protein MUO76_02870, partial [Anaerolineaceae bacterium]|nr:hypothetical protein [Anaerolineaceae bacterium]